jgi:DNA-binding MarR family transcriptional regulator
MKRKAEVEDLSSFRGPEESPGYLLWHISLSWRNAVEAALKPFNLTHPQFVVLATTAWLTREEKKVSQIDISRASGLDPNTTSQVLRGLETKGFVQRVRSMNEKNKNPTLTEVGFSILSRALPAVEKADSNFFTVLDSEELKSLIIIFQKLATHVKIA